ncbi:MAG: ABC transporter permease [Chthoniobacterales bacterium]
MLHRIRTLVVKELQVLLSDPQGRKLLILPVIIQIIVYPAAATLEVRHATLAVMNQDGGAASIELMQRFAGAKAFTHFIMLENDEQLTRVIERQQALVAIQFPNDFSRRLASGRPVAIQAILDGRHSNSAQIALNYVEQMVQDYMMDRAQAAGHPLPSKIVVRHWFNPNLEYIYFLIPSLIATITTIGTLIVTSLSVAREREQGTFDQLLVSPLTPEMIMIGKAIPALLVAMFQASIVLVAGIFFYGIPFEGNLFYLYGSMIFYVTALVGFGLLISSVCTTQQQAFLGVFCFMMPAVLLSGFTAPIDNMPQWLQVITWANPLRHFLNIAKSIFLKDVPFSFIVENVWPLIVISIFTLSAAMWMFRRKAA